MCDFSGKLIAWLDRELPEKESADVERHVRTCVECANNLDLYSRVSSAFDAYCDTVMTSKAGRRVRRWAPVLSGAAAAATLALLLMLPQPPVEQLQPRAQAPAASPAVVVEQAPAPVKTTRPRHAVARVQKQDANWPPAQPPIRIAIPAEAMFPPGAIPEGVNFIADLSIAADGSVQRLRLQPRLAGFERRMTQP
jgi:anti-sigma factor RsiW